jgi:curved DNA-binding protein CbpA
VKEALTVLGLGPGATSVEAKEAYRDLVKVWHPDRFGSDPRLRGKAEEKLKQLNDAYSILQSASETGGYAVEPEPYVASNGRDASSQRSSLYRPDPRGYGGRAKWSVARIGWLYGCLAMMVVFGVGYLAMEQGRTHAATASPAPLAPVVDSSVAATSPTAPATSTTPVKHASGGIVIGAKSHSDAQYHVRLLSGAETELVESACSSLKQREEAAAYRTCLKAQLDSITNASRPADLSALDGAERESIESACAGARRLHGPEGYNRCLSSQMAELAADPARPDLLAMSEADRGSIEAACRGAKHREGPVAYHRCQAGLIKLLAASK